MFSLTEPINHIPTGLEDTGVELYFHDNQLKCLHDGQRYLWNRIPQWIIDRLKLDLEQNHLGKIAVESKEFTFEEYSICRFGGFDGEPDIDANGQINNTEYFDCGRRGMCKYEGKVCATIKVPNGYLTKQELNILKLVAVGKMNKHIADELCISEETVSTHNQNIQRKLGVDNKIEMASFATRKNII